MALQPTDLFLINRYTGSEWKPYRITYSKLLDELGGEFGPDLPSVGYQLALDPTDELVFTTDSPINNKLLKDVKKFILDSSLNTVTFLKKDDTFTAYNITKGTEVTFICTADSTSDSTSSIINCDFVEGDELTTLTLADIITFRKASVISGGGTINSGPCPPGYNYNSGSNSCVADPNYNDKIEEGTLWFNEMNGILYIWHENNGSVSGDGQWVDVRPGGGGGGDGGTVTGDYIPLFSWSTLNTLP